MSAAVGAVLSMVKPVWPVAVRVFPAVSTAPTDAVTVPFPAGTVNVPVYTKPLPERVTVGRVPPVKVPATKVRVGVPESAFVSVKVAVTVTLLPDVYGPVAYGVCPSVYANVTDGAVLSMMNDVVWLDATAAVFPASSEMPLTVSATVAVPSEPEDGTS